MKTYKTADDVEIKVGMEIWINPDCTFKDPLFRTSFVKKQIVLEIKDRKENPIMAQQEGENYPPTGFSPDIIFFDKEKWVVDRKKKYEKVLVEKRYLLDEYIKEKTKEILKICDIIDSL